MALFQPVGGHLAKQGIGVVSFVGLFLDDLGYVAPVSPDPFPLAIVGYLTPAGLAAYSGVDVAGNATVLVFSLLVVR